MKRDTVFDLDWTQEAGVAHLGDGVYARPNGGYLILRVDRDAMMSGQEQQHVIALDGGLIKKLVAYAKTIGIIETDLLGE